MDLGKFNRLVMSFPLWCRIDIVPWLIDRSSWAVATSQYLFFPGLQNIAWEGDLAFGSKSLKFFVEQWGRFLVVSKCSKILLSFGSRDDEAVQVPWTHDQSGSGAECSQEICWGRPGLDSIVRKCGNPWFQFDFYILLPTIYLLRVSHSYIYIYIYIHIIINSSP